MVGCDPKSFFGENVERGNMNTETYAPHVDITEHQYSGRRYNNPDTPFTDNPLWFTKNDIAAQNCSPAKGPWGIIPSRSVMISNLPKTTQLWTIVELLKVLSPYQFLELINRVLETELEFSQRQFPHMGLLLSHSMIYVMHYDVSVTFAQIISLQIVDLTLISFQSLLSSKYASRTTLF
jgi:hypothetical protein